MGKIFCFDAKIYPYAVWVTYDATDEQLNELFPLGDEFGNAFSDMGDIEAIVSEVKEGKGDGLSGQLIRFKAKKYITFGHVAHESDHCAICIFKYIGEQVTYEHQEPFCYLVESIAEFCERVKNNNVYPEEIYADY